MENSQRQDLSKPLNITATKSFTRSPRPSFSEAEPLASSTHPSSFQQTVMDSLNRVSDDPPTKKLLDSPFFISERLAAHKIVLSESNRSSDDKLSVRESRSGSVTSGQVSSKTVSENSGQDIQHEQHHEEDNGESISLSDSIPDHCFQSEKDDQIDYLKTQCRGLSPTQQESVTDFSRSTDLVVKQIDKKVHSGECPSDSLGKTESAKIAEVRSDSEFQKIIVEKTLSGEILPVTPTIIKSEKIEKDEKKVNIPVPPSETLPSVKSIIVSEKMENEEKKEKVPLSPSVTLPVTTTIIESEKIEKDEKKVNVPVPPSETLPSVKSIIEEEKKEKEEEKEKVPLSPSVILPSIVSEKIEKEEKKESQSSTLTEIPGKTGVVGKSYQRSNSDYLYLNQIENSSNEEKIAEIPREFNMDDAPYMRGITGGQFDSYEEETTFPKVNTPKKAMAGRGLKGLFSETNYSEVRTTDENTRTPPTASSQSSTINSPRSFNSTPSGLVLDVDIGEYEKKAKLVERR